VPTAHWNSPKTELRDKDDAFDRKWFFSARRREKNDGAPFLDM